MNAISIRGYGSSIPDEALSRLASIAVCLTARPGTCLIVEGERAGNIFTVAHGTVRLFKSLSDGRRQITGFARSGDYLGVARDDHYSTGAEAITEVRYCRVNRVQWRSLIADFPRLAMLLLDLAADELTGAQEHMLLLGQKTASERVASFLLAQPIGILGQEHAPIDLPMTQGDIADYLGLTSETVCRTLSRLQRADLIDLHSGPPRGLMIRDAERLRFIAAGISAL